MTLKRKTTRYIFLRVLPAVLAVLFLFACSGKPPEIARINWQLNIENSLDRGIIYQALSLFVEGSDPDGLDDIESLYIINDEQQLYWELNEENWIREKRGNETWFGSNHIVMPDGGYFPEGTYRIMLRDVGGDFDEREIYIESSTMPFKTGIRSASTVQKGFSGIYFQSAKIKDGKIIIDRLFPGMEIWLYDNRNKYITMYKPQDTKVEITKIIRLKSTLARGFSFKLYRYNSKIKMGVITGPFYYNPD